MCCLQYSSCPAGVFIIPDFELHAVCGYRRTQPRADWASSASLQAYAVARLPLSHDEGPASAEQSILCCLHRAWNSLVLPYKRCPAIWTTVAMCEPASSTIYALCARMDTVARLPLASSSSDLRPQHRFAPDVSWDKDGSLLPSSAVTAARSHLGPMTGLVQSYVVVNCCSLVHEA